MKLVGFDVTDPLPFTFSAFVRYKRGFGNAIGQYTSYS
jgi:hypothetical protein